MTKANECTCPSGDGSLRHPCPAHPASVELAGVAANLTFINGRPAMCGCQVEYSSGGGEYSDVIYVTLCAKHSGSAILDLVATNRIALTPEYEGKWHADLYLDREIPLAKAEGATPAEAVLALMSAERIDPEQESVEQAGGDERDLQGAQGERDGWGPFPIVQVPWNVFDRAVMWVEDRRRYGDDGTIVDDWKALKTIQRAALAQPSPVSEALIYACKNLAQITSSDGSGHADIAMAVLRMAGVGDDERERLVNEWKAARAWKPSPAQAVQAHDIPMLIASEHDNPDYAMGWNDCRAKIIGASSAAQGEQAEAERLDWSSALLDVAVLQEALTSRDSDERMKNMDAGEVIRRAFGKLKEIRAQHERITAQLHDALDESDGDRWKLRSERDAANARLHEVATACATAEQERDAALARVAELEKQKEFGHVIVSMKGGYKCFEFDEYSHAHSFPEGEHQLYAAPVAQAQHSVPELDQLYSMLGAESQVDAAKKIAELVGCRLSRSALTEAQMRRLYDNSTEAENERLGFAAFARLMRRAEAVHQIAAAPGKEGL
ncbi:TPA: hypothetical protein ACVFG7_006051 [Pseudomonas aeruginosa]